MPAWIEWLIAAGMGSLVAAVVIYVVVVVAFIYANLKNRGW